MWLLLCTSTLKLCILSFELRIHLRILILRYIDIDLFSNNIFNKVTFFTSLKGYIDRQTENIQIRKEMERKIYKDLKGKR